MTTVARVLEASLPLSSLTPVDIERVNRGDVGRPGGEDGSLAN